MTIFPVATKKGDQPGHFALEDAIDVGDLDFFYHSKKLIPSAT